MEVLKGQFGKDPWTGPKPLPMVLFEKGFDYFFGIPASWIMVSYYLENDRVLDLPVLMD